MTDSQMPPFIFVRDRQDNYDLMIVTSTIRYITQNNEGHTSISFVGGGNQEVAHTIPEIVQMLNGDPEQAQKDLKTSQALTDDRKPKNLDEDLEFLDSDIPELREN